MKLDKIYEIGHKRINEALNVSTLIRTIKSNSILLENIIMSQDIEHQIRHMDKNVIDLNDYSKN